jgi:pyruvate formate lyase activating enzyme
MPTEATVFDIQKFSVHDGPGIRTIVFLKGCSLRCKWCANPESNNREPELLYCPSKCIGCGKCVDLCDENAIQTTGNTIRFNRERCKQCMRCTQRCYTGARKVSGKTMSAEEVLKEVEQDMVFYECSGGGVTFSGGEPLLWPDFIVEAGAGMKDRGIHIAVETCGCFAMEDFRTAKPVIDLVLFDLKIIDEEKHRAYCGVSNKQVPGNFKTVIESMIPVVVRMPIIPTVNDSDELLNAAQEFLLPYKNRIQGIHILPYHNLGVGKFDALGRPYALPYIEAPSSEHMRAVKEQFEKKGFSVKIGG